MHGANPPNKLQGWEGGKAQEKRRRRIKGIFWPDLPYGATARTDVRIKHKRFESIGFLPPLGVQERYKRGNLQYYCWCPSSLSLLTTTTTTHPPPSTPICVCVCVSLSLQNTILQPQNPFLLTKSSSSSSSSKSKDFSLYCCSSSPESAAAHGGNKESQDCFSSSPAPTWMKPVTLSLSHFLSSYKPHPWHLSAPQLLHIGNQVLLSLTTNKMSTIAIVFVSSAALFPFSSSCCGLPKDSYPILIAN